MTMSEPSEPVVQDEGWTGEWRRCGCGCGGPWWLGAATVASQRGKGPAQRTDEQIKTIIETALTDDPWLDASGVQVGVLQGVVTLTGMVPSRAAKRRAEALADRVGGVRDVQNTLAIAGLSVTP